MGLTKLLSVIVVTKGDVEELSSTLESLEGIDPKISEIIICSARKDLPKKVSINNLDLENIRFIGSLDKGIYESMNTGIAYSKGEILWFLNGGDSARNLKLVEDIAIILKESAELWLCAMQEDNGYLFLSRSRIIHRLSNLLLVLGIKPIPHQSCLYKREIFEKFGGYNIENRIFADQELNLKLILSNNLPLQVAEMISKHLGGGIGDQQTYGSFKLQVDKVKSNFPMHRYKITFPVKVIGWLVRSIQSSKGKIHEWKR